MVPNPICLCFFLNLNILIGKGVLRGWDKIPSLAMFFMASLTKYLIATIATAYSIKDKCVMYLQICTPSASQPVFYSTTVLLCWASQCTFHRCKDNFDCYQSTSHILTFVLDKTDIVRFNRIITKRIQSSAVPGTINKQLLFVLNHYWTSVNCKL